MFTVVCRDSKTGVTLQATLYVNGKPVSNPVDTHAGNRYVVESRVEGYTTGKLVYIAPILNALGPVFGFPAPAGGDTLEIAMTPLPVASVSLNLQFYPQVRNIQYHLTGPQTSGGMSGDSGFQSVSLLPGVYTLTATYAGYDAYTATVTVTSNTSFIATLTKTADKGTASSDGTTAAVKADAADAADTAVLQITQTEAPDPETLADNFDWEGYYTGAQARVYIGGIFLDELNAIQWTNQGNSVPLYGYSSRFVDAFADGRYIVQGQLVINYVTEGYLYTILADGMKQRRESAGITTDDLEAQQMKALLSMIAKVGDHPSLSTAAADAAQVQTDAALRRVAQLVKNPNAVRLAKQNTAGKDTVRNAIYQKTLFDITVEVGTNPSSRSVRRLVKCRLTTNETLFDQSGMPIAETYGFLARKAM